MGDKTLPPLLPPVTSVSVFYCLSHAVYSCKGKVIRVRAIKAYRNGGIAPFILDLVLDGTQW